MSFRDEKNIILKIICIKGHQSDEIRVLIKTMKIKRQRAILSKFGGKMVSWQIHEKEIKCLRRQIKPF